MNRLRGVDPDQMKVAVRAVRGRRLGQVSGIDAVASSLSIAAAMIGAGISKRRAAYTLRSSRQAAQWPSVESSWSTCRTPACARIGASRAMPRRSAIASAS